uniref:Uncharacterized protein n=1 Tax=Arion vulgaris TaxID=1028688 RepID=A0A0B7AKY6_9EUPU
MWIYRRIGCISWKAKQTNKEVLDEVMKKELLQEIQMKQHNFGIQRDMTDLSKPYYRRKLQDDEQEENQDTVGREHQGKRQGMLEVHSSEFLMQKWHLMMR